MNESCVKEKLQFFPVRLKEAEVKLSNNSLSLGPDTPSYIDSVADLYIFDTLELAYQQRIRGRKLDLQQDKRDLLVEKSPSKLDTKGLDDAPMPHSILHPDWNARQPGDSFFYSPTINDAPDLDLPEDLEDLPGIAIDIGKEVTTIKKKLFDEPSSSSSSIVGVAPGQLIKEEVDAVNKQNTTPALPSLPSFTANNNEPVKDSQINLPPIAGAPPPPPPPPPPPQTPPAPPAPPALPSLNLNPADGETKSSSTTTTVLTKATVTTDARSNLMDAIRKAGGKAKLRAAAPMQNDKKTSVVTEGKTGSSDGAGGSGNLMDDLHKKLMMRRKGISGAKKPSSVMDRLSDLIPPPAEGSGGGGTTAADDEEDWN